MGYPKKKSLECEFDPRISIGEVERDKRMEHNNCRDKFSAEIRRRCSLEDITRIIYEHRNDSLMINVAEAIRKHFEEDL